jgi:hypothetical protein
VSGGIISTEQPCGRTCLGHAGHALLGNPDDWPWVATLGCFLECFSWWCLTLQWRWQHSVHVFSWFNGSTCSCARLRMQTNHMLRCTICKSGTAMVEGEEAQAVSVWASCRLGKKEPIKEP